MVGRNVHYVLPAVLLNGVVGGLGRAAGRAARRPRRVPAPPGFRGCTDLPEYCAVRLAAPFHSRPIVDPSGVIQFHFGKKPLSAGRFQRMGDKML